MKRFITAIFSLVISGTLCMPLVSGYAESDSENSLYIEDIKFSRTDNISADTMPYYIKEVNSGEKVDVSIMGKELKAVFVGK
ncbi:MAG: hypothetical protein K2J32_03235 [Ruminococcus sp.]|nr:hypothetical protein [Ruminococcus sp.]